MSYPRLHSSSRWDLSPCVICPWWVQSIILKVTLTIPVCDHALSTTNLAARLHLYPHTLLSCPIQRVDCPWFYVQPLHFCPRAHPPLGLCASSKPSSPAYVFALSTARLLLASSCDAVTPRVTACECAWRDSMSFTDNDWEGSTAQGADVYLWHVAAESPVRKGLPLPESSPTYIHPWSWQMCIWCLLCAKLHFRVWGIQRWTKTIIVLFSWNLELIGGWRAGNGQIHQ